MSNRSKFVVVIEGDGSEYVEVDTIEMILKDVYHESPEIRFHVRRSDND